MRVRGSGHQWAKSRLRFFVLCLERERESERDKRTWVDSTANNRGAKKA